MSEVHTNLVESVVENDIECAGCGYNLRSLQVSSKCPECGLEVKNSIDVFCRRVIKLGPPLTEQSENWLLIVGIGFLAYSIAPIVSGLMWTIVPSNTQTHAKMLAAESVLTIAMWAATFCFTLRPFQESVQAKWLRRITRVLLSAWFGYLNILIVSVLAVGVDRAQKAVLISTYYIHIQGLFSAFGTIAGFGYLSLLAGRLARPVLRRTCLGMSIAAIPMIVWTAGMTSLSVWMSYIVGFLPSPGTPLVSNPLQAILFVGHLNSINAYRLERNALTILWVICSLSVLIWFSYIFISLAAAKRGKSSSNSAT